MPQLDKSKLLAFAKKKATPPPAGALLAQKRAGAPPAPAAPPPVMAKPKGPPQPAAPSGPEGEDQETYLYELVEEAAQEAEAGKDTELEDIIAGYTSKTPQDVPDFVTDPEKWAEAAEAVGLGGAGEDQYAEPFVVAAYLYRKIGGEVKGLEMPEAPNAPEAAPADMAKPGAAAKAIATRAASKAAPGAPSKPAAAPAPAAAKPKVPAPAPSSTGTQSPMPQGGGEEGGGDELKQLTDQAAAEATTNPDPELTEKLQLEPPQEGVPPTWADPEMWGKAEEAVKANWDAYPDPWIVVAHTYKLMGGAVLGEGAPVPAPGIG